MKFKINLGAIEAKGLKIENIVIETEVSVEEIRTSGDIRREIVEDMPKIASVFKDLLDHGFNTFIEIEKDRTRQREEIEAQSARVYNEMMQDIRERREAKEAVEELEKDYDKALDRLEKRRLQREEKKRNREEAI